MNHRIIKKLFVTLLTFGMVFTFFQNTQAIPLRQLIEGGSFFKDNFLLTDWSIVDNQNINIDNLDIGDGYDQDLFGLWPTNHELSVSGIGTKSLTLEFQVISIGGMLTNISAFLAYRSYNIVNTTGYIRADFSLGTSKGSDNLGNCYHVFMPGQDYNSGNIVLSDTLNKVWVKCKLTLNSWSYAQNFLESGYIVEYGGYNAAYRIRFNSNPYKFPTIEVLDADQEIRLLQNSQVSTHIRLINTSMSEQNMVFEILNSNYGLNVSLDSIQDANINSGGIVNLPLTFSGTISCGLYNVLLKIALENGEIYYTPLKVKVMSEENLHQGDLSVLASDIHLVEHTTNGPAKIAVTVHNNGTTAASYVPVSLYLFNNLVNTTTINSIEAGSEQTTQIIVPNISSGDHLIKAAIDEEDAISEIDETNNVASKIITIGSQSVHPGGILVTASLPREVYTDALFTISGRTMYDIIVDGIRYLNFPVKGGAVTLTISDDNGHSWKYGNSHSTISGDFSNLVQAPSATGHYTFTISATDQTFSGSRTVDFTVIERPLQPPLPPLPPNNWFTGEWIWNPVNWTWEWKWSVLPPGIVPQYQDVHVFAENIHFSNNNPGQGEEITILSEFKYWSTSTIIDALNVPVNMYVTRPGSDKIKIGSTIIDRMSVSAPQNGSSYVYVNWKNYQDGIYIVEAEIDPSYIEPNMKNNAATRAIIIGEYANNYGILSGQVTGPEGGMKDIRIELYDGYGMLRYTTTNDNGFYLIDSLQVGTDTVKCVIPNGYASDTVSRVVEIVDQHVSIVNFYLYIQDIPEVPPVPFKDTLDSIINECEVIVIDTPLALDQWGDTLKGKTDDSLSYTEQGEYVITWRYTDSNGNTTTQPQTVVVKDTTPPDISPLPTLTGECGVQITAAPVAIDKCTGVVTGTTTASLPQIFNKQGTYHVVWTFNDGHGNSTVQTQTVIVADTVAPVPDIAKLPDITGTGGVTISTIPTATDNCAGPVNGTTTDPFSYQQPGIYIITWNYTDSNGNTSSQQQKVVVTQPGRCITNTAARTKLDKIQLTWTDDGSSQYHIFRSTESEATGFQQIAVTTSTYSTYLDAGLVIGKRYWYKVTGDGNCSTRWLSVRCLKTECVVNSHRATSVIHQSLKWCISILLNIL